MNSRWYRCGNFYDNSEDMLMRTQHTRNYVSFRNAAPFVIVKEISIHRHDINHTNLHLHASPFLYQQLLFDCRRFFTNDEFEADPDSSLLIIKKFSPAALIKVTTLFNYLNYKFTISQFSHDILTELSQLSAMLQMHPDFFPVGTQHIINEGIFAAAHVNPARARSTALAELLDRHDYKNTPTREIKYLLLQGDDPNQIGGNYETSATYYAAWKYTLDVLKLMLFYGGNPFFRGGRVFESAAEAAMKFREHDKLNAIMVSTSQLEQPLQIAKSARPALTIKELKVLPLNKQVYTEFIFSDQKTLSTWLKKPKQLTDVEIECVFKLYSLFFEKVDPQQKITLKELLNQDLKGDNKLIELIYFEEKIIGFNIFEIVKSKRREQHLFVHCVLSVIHPLFRGYGVMSLLIFRIGFGLQKLAPENKVSIFFSAIHSSSYFMVKDFLHFPKYQPQPMLDLMQDILSEVFNSDVKLYHDLITCYTQEQIYSRAPTRSQTKSQPDLIEEFFYQEILGVSNQNRTTGRGAPILFHVADDSFKRLQHLLDNLKADFSQHVTELSLALRELMPEFKLPAQQAKSLPRSDMLFFQDVQATSDYGQYCYKPIVRAKLS